MTTILTYNPRNRIAKTTIDYIKSLGVFTITQTPSSNSKKKQKFADDFRKAVEHGKAFKEGKMEFRSMEDLLNEL